MHFSLTHKASQRGASSIFNFRLVYTHVTSRYSTGVVILITHRPEHLFDNTMPGLHQPTQPCETSTTGSPRPVGPTQPLITLSKSSSQTGRHPSHNTSRHIDPVIRSRYNKASTIGVRFRSSVQAVKFAVFRAQFTEGSLRILQHPIRNPLSPIPTPMCGTSFNYVFTAVES